MSLRDEIDQQAGGGQGNGKPVKPFIRQLNRAGACASNPFFESQGKRSSRAMYEACWNECVHPELTADESLTIRVNLGEFYHRKYPERVKQIGEYQFMLLNPSAVIEVSDRQRANEARGFTPESIRLPPEPPDTVSPGEIAGMVKPRPMPPPPPPVPSTTDDGATDDEMPF